MSPPALRLVGVQKRYGKNVALDGLDLEIPAGVICGFIGPNGAGKTTTFSIAGGSVRPDAGQVDLLGQGPFDPAVHAGRVALLPQDCALNPYTSVRDLLIFYARLQGMDKAPAQREADRVLDEVALADRAASRIHQLSHGMRRRVAVAQALLGDPALVMLDEPTSGLDPHLVVRLRDLFLAQRGRRTMVISSHVLAELEAVCDHVVFVERGRAVKAGPIDEVTGRAEVVQVTLSRADQAGLALDALAAALPELVVRAEHITLTATAPTGWTVAGLNARLLPILLDAGVAIEEIRRGHSLEERYMQERAKAIPGESG